MRVSGNQLLTIGLETTASPGDWPYPFQEINACPPKVSIKTSIHNSRLGKICRSNRQMSAPTG